MKEVSILEMRPEDLEKLRRELAKKRKSSDTSKSQKWQKTVEATSRSPSKTLSAPIDIVLASSIPSKAAKLASLPPPQVVVGREGVVKAGTPNGNDQQSSGSANTKGLQIEAPISMTSPRVEGSTPTSCNFLIVVYVNHFDQHINPDNPLTNIQADPIPLGMPIRICLRTLQKEANRVKRKAAKAKWRLSKMKKNFEIVSVELKGVRVRTWPTTQVHLAERNRLQKECKKMAKLAREKA
ncbi:hypothetical protein COCNU_scaffold002597G000010 [Cocos nucifera]|nr:hypothetical protein [Cocos nucifera]